MRSRLVQIALASAAVAALAAPLPAQTPTQAAVQTPRDAAPAPPRTPTESATPTASQSAAARELFKSLKLEESVSNTAAAMVDSEISHNPGLAPYRDILAGWLRKYMTWDAMLPELTKVYAETYTESEMKSLATFYRSPLGQKALAKTPELLSKTAAIGAKISQPHTAELNAQLTARRDQLKAQAAARAPGAKSPPPADAVPASTTPRLKLSVPATPAPKSP